MTLSKTTRWLTTSGSLHFYQRYTQLFAYWRFHAAFVAGYTRAVKILGRGFSLALAFWNVMTALCGLAQNFLQLVVARVLVGAGEAGASPPSRGAGDRPRGDP